MRYFLCLCQTLARVESDYFVPHMLGKRSEWWIQEFSRGPTTKRDANLLFGLFSRKLYENERNWTERGSANAMVPAVV